MSVELIISQGSLAGTAATIRPGYYLVGRVKECQIRPKSRSVSRRHCLLLRNDDGFGALDLKSTRGTFVNGTRLQPHQWRVLKDGDEIRFGKVAFRVAIKEPELAVLGSISAEQRNGAEQRNSAEQRNHAKLDDTGSETPESWQNIDVAEFLKEENLVGTSLDCIDEQLVANASDSEGDVLSEELSEAFSDSKIEAMKANDTFVGDVIDDADDGEEDDKGIVLDSVPKKRPPRKKIDHKQYKRGPKRELKLPSFGLGSIDGLGWKLSAAVAIAILTFGLLAYQIYRFNRPAGIEVRQNLD